MRKLTLCFIPAFSLLLLSSISMKAATDAKPVIISTEAAVKSTEPNTAEVRLNEIKTMDKASLASSERKELRNEIRSIRSEGRMNSETTYVEGGHNGVYISVGAALLIVLLLILLL
jgi:hypothetical protein